MRGSSSALLETTTVCAAAVYRSHGGPEVLELDPAWPLPQCGSGDVVIKVHASSVNPVDYKFMGGFLKMVEGFVGLTPPCCGGFDVAGVVVHAGRKCSRLSVGNEVWAMANFKTRGNVVYGRAPPFLVMILL